MSDKPTFFKIAERSTAVANTPAQVEFFRHESACEWIEISEEEFEFIVTHWPDDPKWVARYGHPEDTQAS